MSVSRPHVRLEIFCEPKFFADHFAKGWMQTPAGQVTVEEDTAKLTIKSGEAEQHFGKNVSPVFDTSVYKYLIVRIPETSADWNVLVQRADNEQWVNVAFGSSPGLFTVNMAPVYGGNIKAVDLVAEGSAGEYVTFDYVVMAKDYFFPPERDISGQLTVTHSLLNSEVNTANVNLSSFTDQGDTYLNISENSKLIVWISRVEAELGTTAAKVFGGKLASKSEEYFGYNVANVKLEAHGHAAELFDSPALVYKLCSAENGRTIIEEALALCNYVAKYPHGVGWFDEGGPYGSTDDRIGSSHDAEFDEVKPFTVLKEILDKAANPAGVVGFDVFEVPSGVLVGHLRESEDFVCPLSPTLRYALKTVDAHRVKNRQKVYGAIGRTIPEDCDEWTESTDGWIVDNGTLVTDPSVKQKGAYSLNAENQYSPYTIQFRRNIEDLVFGFGKKAARKLDFWRKIQIGPIVRPTFVQVRLWAPDENNYFYASLFRVNAESDLWSNLELLLGPSNVYDETENPNDDLWHAYGSPSWTDLRWLCFRAESNYAMDLWIDALHFGDLPFYAEHNDPDSIDKYGTKEAEPVVDQTLLSNAECLARAKGILEKIKYAPVALEPLTVDGDYRYRPGDIMTDGVDSFRIVQVKHTLQAANWDTKLTVSEVI